MKFNTFMPSVLKPYYQKELDLYHEALSYQNYALAWSHLERAHIIGQSYPFAHNLAHWKMLVFAFKMKDLKEFVGQLPRLFVGGIKSFVGKIPLGNPGGANVPPLKPFPISPDLQEILNRVEN